MIPGIIAIPGGGAAKSAVFQGTYGSTTNASSFTFSSVNLGVPDVGRIIVIGVNYYEYDTSTSISTLTVAGSSATGRVTSSNGVPGGTGSNIYAAIWSLSLATGSTGTVSLQFNRSIDRGCSIGVWSLYNMSSSTPQATDTADGNSAGAVAALTTLAQADDAIIAVATGAESAGATTWTNITEDYDTRVSPSGGLSRSGASLVALSNNTVNIGVSNASGQITAALARWR